jgi:two-component system sensor histidine kinase LytS
LLNRFSAPLLPNTLVQLAEELSVVSAYLEIESLRLPDQLEVIQNVDSRLTQALVPPFSLQGLVENALEHRGSQKSIAFCRRYCGEL